MPRVKDPNTPHCLKCGSTTKKKAKSLVAYTNRTKKKYYTMAAKDPIFCSLICAAAWALCEIGTLADQKEHWCPSQQKWEMDPKEQCERCSPETCGGYREEEEPY